MTQTRQLARRARRRSNPLPVWLGFAAGLVLVGAGLFALTAQSGASAARSTTAPEISLRDFSGKTYNLTDYRGKPVLINLWASWCPPCRAEMPTLINFYQDHAKQGLVLLAVNTTDDAAPAQQFLRQVYMPFPVLYDPDGQAEKAFDAYGLPDTFFIDRDGRVRFSWTGEISQAVLDQRVGPLLTQ